MSVSGVVSASMFRTRMLPVTKKIRWYVNVVFAVLVVAGAVRAQIPSPVYDSEKYTNLSSTAQPFSGVPKFTGYGVVSFTLFWTGAGTATGGCTLRLEGANTTPPPTVDSSWTALTVPDKDCGSASPSGGVNVSLAQPYQWIRIYVSNLTGKPTGMPAYSVQFSLEGTLAGAGSFQFFGVPGMPIVQGSFAQYQVSPAAVYVSALNGGYLSGSGADACAAINYALANSLYPGQTVVVDLQGDQPCLSNPFSQVPGRGNACSGNVLIGPGANYHLQGSSSTWIIPTHCRVIFTGQGLVGGIASGSIVSACDTTTTFACASTFASGTPLACFSAATTCTTTSSNAAIEFDSVIVGGTFDCRYVLNCIGIQNYNAQENSGVFGSSIIGWGNGGIGLDIGCNVTSGGCGSGSPTTSAANSTYEHLQINNQMPPASGGCNIASVGIRINSGATMLPPNTSFPRKISDVTIANGGCVNAGVGSYPNDGIQIGGGDGIELSAIHIEHTTRAAIDVGNVTLTVGNPLSDTILPTVAVSLDEVSCSTTLGIGAGACILIPKQTTPTTLVASNVVIHSVSVSQAQYVIQDGNNTPIATDPTTHSGVVAQYVTDTNSNVHSDSSYTNSPVLGSPSIVQGSQVFYSNSYTYPTTIKPAPSTAAPTAPVVVNLPSASGTLATTLDTVGNLATSHTFNDGTNTLTFNGQSTGSQPAFSFAESSAGSGTTEVAISTASGSTAVPLSVTGILASGQTLPTVSITPSWSLTSSLVDAALLINPTTGGALGSLLIDAQLGGTSQWKVDKGGDVTEAGGLTLSGTTTSAATIGTSNTNQTLTLQPNGTGMVNVTDTPSTTTSALTVTPTWNSAGNFAGALLVNPTNTTSGSGSLLVDFQLGGTSEWKVDEGGDVIQKGSIQAGAYTTNSNCSGSSSPLTCGSAAAGRVAVAAGTNQTFQVNTTAITANSEVFVEGDPSATISSVTCNTSPFQPFVTSRTAGSFFVIKISGTTSGNPICVDFFIVN
jgi:hypothetical protein